MEIKIDVYDSEEFAILGAAVKKLDALHKERAEAREAKRKEFEAARSARRAAATSDQEADEADAADADTPVPLPAPALKQVVSDFSSLAKVEPAPSSVLTGSVEVFPSNTPTQAVFVSDAGTIFDQDDVIQATLQLASEVSIPAATDLLKEFGVERARDVAGTDWEKYVTRAKGLVTAHKAAKNAQA